MVEEEIGVGGGGGGNSSRVSPPSTSTVAAGAGAVFALPAVEAASKGRQMFTVELKPGETTFVSWKKLIKEASNKIKPINPLPPSLPDTGGGDAVAPPPGAKSALESRIAPAGQREDAEMKDAPTSHRFSAVIEKIERLYMGKQSSDEEELDDIPDDDQYDTDDSFIDDAELDQYFQVDKSTTKHSGFFVNRGKLERVNEHVSSPKVQPKKRRRKDLTRTSGDNDAEHLPNKHAKMGNVRMKAAARTSASTGNKSSQSLVAATEHIHDGKPHEQLNASIEPPIKKKLSDSKAKSEHIVSSKVQIKDASSIEAKDTDRQKSSVVQSRDLGSKSKVVSDPLCNAHQIYRDSSTSAQLESPSRKFELTPANKVQQRRKGGSDDFLEHPVRRAKSASMRSKEGSSIRSKGTMLERAIRELELIVSQSRPPSAETLDADNAFPGIKRRLPREVKQKLAKVARLAQSSQGKISEELLNRLMGIVGHLMQLKTLKRNLKAMVELGLSAKQEKDDRYQQIKNEVIEMIRTHASPSKSKDETFDEFREGTDSKEKGLMKRTYSMDHAMEDKICELYDLYVEGMDEDKGPQIRKLYVELAELWPSGLMDNHGIKNAVCRAKERKRELHGRHKEEEKIKMKKLCSSTPRADRIVSGETSSVAQQTGSVVPLDKMHSENNSETLTSNSKMTSTQTSISQQHFSTMDRNVSSPNVSMIKHSSSTDWPKQEKGKCSSSSFLDKARKTLDGLLMKQKARKTLDGLLMKQKAKKRSESDSGDNNCRPVSEKLPSQQHNQQQGKERERQKKVSHKQAVVSGQIQ